MISNQFRPHQDSMCYALAVPADEGAESPYRESIAALGDEGQWQDALQLFSDMCQLDPGGALTAPTFAAVTMACSRMTQWYQVQQLLQKAMSNDVRPEDVLLHVEAPEVTLIPGLRWKTDKSDKEDWSWNTEEASGGSGGSEKEDGKGKAVVLTHRLPDDYLENTLLPHLESQLLYNIHIYTPAELTQIAKAYAKMEVRQLALCRKLAGHMKERMKGFEAIDVIDALGAMWIMVPDDEELFEALEQKIYEKMEDFTAPNFMGIIRVYNKMASKHHTLLSKVIPRLRELLANYEGVELSEMLVSMAQSVDSDMDILMTLVPEVEKRYNEVSLLHSVNNVWALCQMKIVHEGLLKRVAEDLCNPTKSKDLPAGYMARVAWIYRRCNRWDLISEALLPMIRSSAAEFSPGDFARLAQALPEEGQLLRRIAQNLVGGFTDMGRKDFLLYLVGCVHGEVLEERPEANQPYGELTQACLNYIKEDQDNFARDEVQKMVYLLHHSKYHYLEEELPPSLNAIKQETIDFIRAKGASR
ncbi:unnamed protein product [Durusdinium trenchii]|uniref:Uncharacterized protein n=1 Tax=Durusdinium trenchii TaxID=1381693 RepID=A0ABP0N7Q8_9DINO